MATSKRDLSFSDTYNITPWCVAYFIHSKMHYLKSPCFQIQIQTVCSQGKALWAGVLSLSHYVSVFP